MDLETFVGKRSAVPAADRPEFDAGWASSLTNDAIFDAIQRVHAAGNGELVALLASHIAGRIRDGP